jgi:hypothetical protein
MFQGSKNFPSGSETILEPHQFAWKATYPPDLRPNTYSLVTALQGYARPLQTLYRVDCHGDPQRHFVAAVRLSTHVMTI